MENIKNRKIWVDWSKAILIWLMVLGHAGLSGYSREFVYAFHIPAFFIISGYLYKPHNWRKTLRSFGIPVVCFSFVNLCYVILRQWLKGDMMTPNELLISVTTPYWKCNFGEYISLFRGVWFVVVLFFMRLLCGDIKIFNFVRQYYKFFLSLLLVYMTIEPLFIDRIAPAQYYYLYKVIACLPFMMVGFYLKENDEKLLSLKWSWLVLLIIVYITLTLFNGSADMWAHKFGQHYIIFFINATVASLLFYNICKRFRTNGAIIMFSIGTLLILGLHDPILQVCTKIYDVVGLTHLYVLSSFIVMFVCYWLIRIALKYNPALLGK